MPRSDSMFQAPCCDCHAALIVSLRSPTNDTTWNPFTMAVCRLQWVDEGTYAMITTHGTHVTYSIQDQYVMQEIRIYMF